MVSSDWMKRDFYRKWLGLGGGGALFLFSDKILASTRLGRQVFPLEKKLTFIHSQYDETE